MAKKTKQDLIGIAKSEYESLFSSADKSEDPGEVYSAATYLAFEVGLEDTKTEALHKGRKAYQTLVKKAKQRVC